MAIAGKNVVVAASTNGTTFNTVAELNDASMSISGDNIDVTEFGDQFINRIQGLKDVSWSLSGFYVHGDTQGQAAIRTALINDSAIYIRIFWDGSTGFRQEVKVSTFEVSAAVDGEVAVSIELEGTGPVTVV